MLSVQYLVMLMQASPVQVMEKAVLVAQKQEVRWLVTVLKKNHFG